MEGEFINHYTDRDSDEISEQIFKGVVIVIDMKKPAEYQTVIVPSSLLSDIKTGFIGLKKINLEDVVFEQKYDVYSQDQIEARYMITTSFMERMNNLQTIYDVNDVRCAFYKDKIIFAFNTGLEDWFEPMTTVRKDILTLKPLHDNLNDAEKNFYHLFDELLAVLEMIDYFKLNQDIGL